MTFRERHHAVWRELLNCEPLNAEDGQVLLGHLQWIATVTDEGVLSQERLNAATNFLEERAFLISRMTREQRDEVERFRHLTLVRQRRDSWQKAAPRTLTKAEHDALLDVEVGTTKAVDRQEYERMMREARE